MFKLAPFLLGSIAAGGLSFMDPLPTFLPIASGPSLRTRSPGGRARKRWKRARASGRR